MKWEMERCHGGRGSQGRMKSREMDWWRPERDRKWIYIHHSFCAPFDFWKWSRCGSAHTAASIAAQCRTGLQMNMEQAEFATLAGSFPTVRQIFSQSVTSPLLWKDACWVGGGEGGALRNRMRNLMTVTEWQKANKRMAEWRQQEKWNVFFVCF